MTAELIGALVDSAIPLAAGLFATAYGLGFVGKPQDATAKPRQILKVLGPLLVAYGCLMIGLALIQDRSDDGEGRAMFVAAANTKAGELVDEETRLLSVTDAGTHIQFDYQLFRLTRAQLDPAVLKSALAETMQTYLCTNDTPRQALAAWGPFTMRYVDAAQVEVVSLSMTAADCP